MTDHVVLRPARAALADWRAIYRGAQVILDPVARADVEAGAAVLQSVLARDRASIKTGRASPTVADLLQRGGDPLPAGLARLFLALKVASLGQGLAGVRWTLVQTLAECLSRDLLPAIQSRQVSDRLALAHLFALVTGTGEVLGDPRRTAASKALKTAGLKPLKLSPAEKQVLLSGTELSTAFALAGLFEAERVFQSALVSAALSTAAVGLPGVLLHPQVHRLSRQPGQSEVARSLRELLAADLAETAAADGESPRDVTESRRFASRMGACLDLLRNAGDTLARAANAPSGGPLVLWQTAEIVAGTDDTSSIVLAADQIALALRELGALAERGIGLIPSSADAHPGSGLQLTAASFTKDIRARACHAGGEAEEDFPLVSAPGAPRLLRMAGAASLVVVIELLAAARACDRAASPPAGDALAKVRGLLRDTLPMGEEQNEVSPADLAGAAELVRSGVLAGATGLELPSLTPALALAL